MTRTQFCDKLRENWGRMSDGVLDSVEKKLSFYSEKDINDIWQELHETYTQVSAPTYAHVINIIKNNGIQPARGEVLKRHYIYVCNECETPYAGSMESLVAICCPDCLSENRHIEEYDGTKHHKVDTYQYKCIEVSTASHYKAQKCKLLGVPGASGATCKSWGINQNRSECKDCKCEECCKGLIKENREHNKRERKFEIEKLKCLKKLD